MSFKSSASLQRWAPRLTLFIFIAPTFTKASRQRRKQGIHSQSRSRFESCQFLNQPMVGLSPTSSEEAATGKAPSKRPSRVSGRPFPFPAHLLSGCFLPPAAVQSASTKSAASTRPQRFCPPHMQQGGAGGLQLLKSIGSNSTGGKPHHLQDEGLFWERVEVPSPVLPNCFSSAKGRGVPPHPTYFHPLAI